MLPKNYLTIKIYISIISFLFISSTVFAYPKHVSYLSLDGVSRDTFFASAKK